MYRGVTDMNLIHWERKKLKLVTAKDKSTWKESVEYFVRISILSVRKSQLIEGWKHIDK
jgi:hypothetical protein